MSHPAFIRRGARTLAVAAAIALPLCIACGGGAYVTAAGTFATAESTSTQSLSGLGDTLKSNCLARANVTFVQMNLAMAAPPDGSAPAADWPTFFKTAHATPQLTWTAYCDEVAATATLFQKGVSVLNQYGSALKSLATGATYSGTNVTSLAGDASSIATSLKDSSLAGPLKSIDKPINAIAAYLQSGIVNGEIKSVVVEADPPIQQILKAMADYLDDVRRDWAETTRRQRDVLAWAEAKSPTLTAGDPLQKVYFYDFETRTLQQSQAVDAALASDQSVVKAIGAAHTALVAAGKNEGESEIKDLLSLVQQLMQAASGQAGPSDGGTKG